MGRSELTGDFLDADPEWAAGYSAWLPERIPPVRRVGYTLVDLARRRLLEPESVEAFQQETGLSDFAWRVLWADPAVKPDAESVANALRSAAGVVVFVHGWTGTGDIWEDLPAMLVRENPDLIALVPDVNGFGGSPFSMAVPPLHLCDPPAVMRQLERWLEVIGLHTDTAPHRRPFIFVGHSMGGASLFFADDKKWKLGELGRIAVAPALLMNDRSRQRFYRTLGAGIRFSGLTQWLDQIAERFVAPRIIRVLAGGASDRVQAEHMRIYRSTTEGTVAQTFAAMGTLKADLEKVAWPYFQVMLARGDGLVGAELTQELLLANHFDPDQINLTDGDHYFFSVGRRDRVHAYNREALIASIFVLRETMSSALATL